MNNLYNEINKLNKNNCIIEFNNDILEIHKRTRKSPYKKTICGMGYIGEGNYVVSINKTFTMEYRYWQSMISRCYNKKRHVKYITYKNVDCCNEWLNFQVFAKWFDENYYQVEGQRMDLDKDILHKGNKVYSPNDCIFVPQRINLLFTRRQNSRGQYPIGVTYNKKDRKFRAYCSIFENNKQKQILLGSFDTSDEAFNTYKQFKESYIKQVADEYKNKIPIELYNALYEYKIEITD